MTRSADWSPLCGLAAADAELGHMLGTLRALRPVSALPSVAPAFNAAQAAVRAAQIPSVIAFGVDVADETGLLDPLKELPLFNLQPGGSW